MFLLQQYNLNVLGWGALLGLNDALILSLLKAFNIGLIKWKGIFVIAMIVYAFQPLIFYKGLDSNGLTVMNIVWDVTSIIIVTLIGTFYFSEKLNIYKKLGVFLSFISILLLMWKD